MHSYFQSVLEDDNDDDENDDDDDDGTPPWSWSWFYLFSICCCLDNKVVEAVIILQSGSSNTLATTACFWNWSDSASSSLYRLSSYFLIIYSHTHRYSRCDCLLFPSDFLRPRLIFISFLFLFIRMSTVMHCLFSCPLLKQQVFIVLWLWWLLHPSHLIIFLRQVRLQLLVVEREREREQTWWRSTGTNRIDRDRRWIGKLNNQAM